MVSYEKSCKNGIFCLVWIFPDMIKHVHFGLSVTLSIHKNIVVYNMLTIFRIIGQQGHMELEDMGSNPGSGKEKNLQKKQVRKIK